MKPVIGISARVRREDRFYGVGMDYAEAVVRAGGTPVMIPPIGEPVAAVIERIDGLLLTGGPDVDPALYGGEMHEAVYGVDPVRDASEIAALRKAMERRMPVLGICRGAQLINVALGGTLIEHLDGSLEGVLHRSNESKGVRHRVDLAPGTVLATVVGSTSACPVSFHHQAVRKLAAGLEAAAHAPDGVVEAFVMPGYPFLIAVQWHPEMTAAEDPSQQAIFDAFVQAALRFAGAEPYGAR